MIHVNTHKLISYFLIDDTVSRVLCNKFVYVYAILSVKIMYFVQSV